MLLETLSLSELLYGVRYFELVSLNYFCVCAVVSIVLYNQRE